MAIVPGFVMVATLAIIFWILSAKIKTYKYLKEKKLQRANGYGQQASQP